MNIINAERTGYVGATFRPGRPAIIYQFYNRGRLWPAAERAGPAPERAGAAAEPQSGIFHEVRTSTPSGSIATVCS
jgi:hypothetical protein